MPAVRRSPLAQGGIKMDDIYIFPNDNDTLTIVTCLKIEAAIKEVRMRGWDYHEALEQGRDLYSGWYRYIATKMEDTR